MDNKTEILQKNKNQKDYISDSGIKVKVVYPQNVSEAIRRQKINCIYDILTGHQNSDDNKHSA